MTGRHLVKWAGGNAAAAPLSTPGPCIATAVGGGIHQAVNFRGKRRPHSSSPYKHTFSFKHKRAAAHPQGSSSHWHWRGSWWLTSWAGPRPAGSCSSPPFSASITDPAKPQPGTLWPWPVERTEAQGLSDGTFQTQGHYSLLQAVSCPPLSPRYCVYLQPPHLQSLNSPG